MTKLDEVEKRKCGYFNGNNKSYRRYSAETLHLLQLQGRMQSLPRAAGVLQPRLGNGDIFLRNSNAYPQARASASHAQFTDHRADRQAMIAAQSAAAAARGGARAASAAADAASAAIVLARHQAVSVRFEREAARAATVAAAREVQPAAMVRELEDANAGRQQRVASVLEGLGQQLDFARRAHAFGQQAAGRVAARERGRQCRWQRHVGGIASAASTAVVPDRFQTSSSRIGPPHSVSGALL